MKKYIVMSIIAVVALLPFAAWADTGGSASAILDFTSVINVSLVTWGDSLTVNQADIAGWGATTELDFGDLTISLMTLTDYNLWSCYYAKEAGADVDPAFGDPNDLLILDGQSAGTYDGPLLHNYIADPLAYAGPYADPSLKLLFSGSNNFLGMGDNA